MPGPRKGSCALLPFHPPNLETPKSKHIGHQSQHFLDTNGYLGSLENTLTRSTWLTRCGRASRKYWHNGNQQDQPETHSNLYTKPWHPKNQVRPLASWLGLVSNERIEGRSASGSGRIAEIAPSDRDDVPWAFQKAFIILDGVGHNRDLGR